MILTLIASQNILFFVLIILFLTNIGDFPPDRWPAESEELCLIKPQRVGKKLRINPRHPKANVLFAIAYGPIALAVIMFVVFRIYV